MAKYFYVDGQPTEVGPYPTLNLMGGNKGWRYWTGKKWLRHVSSKAHAVRTSTEPTADRTTQWRPFKWGIEFYKHKEQQ